MQYQAQPGTAELISKPQADAAAFARPLPGLTVVIQAGGASSRMGRSKALVEFLGEPLVVRGVRRFKPIAEEVVVTTNEPDAVGALLEAHGLSGVRLTRDLYAERGALKGIHTALDAVRTEYAALVAVDMVDASPALIAAEYAELVARGDGFAAAYPHVDGGYEPFHAVYRVPACLPLVAGAAGEGINRATGWFTPDVQLLEVDEAFVECVAADSALGPFANANTPAELAALQDRALTENK